MKVVGGGLLEFTEMRIVSFLLLTTNCIMVLVNRKKDELKEAVFKVLKKVERPISTQDISLELSKPWHSIQTRCLMLQIDGRVNGFRVGRMNLWQAK